VSQEKEGRQRNRYVGLDGADADLSRAHNPRYSPALDTMSTALPTIVFSGWSIVVGVVTVGLTAANDVLGLAGEGGVGLSVSGGRSLEVGRVGEGVEVDEERTVWRIAPLGVVVRAISTLTLSDDIVVTECVRPQDGVEVLSVSSAKSTSSGSSFSIVGRTCLGIIVDALLDEEDDEAKLASMLFKPTDRFAVAALSTFELVLSLPQRSPTSRSFSFPAVSRTVPIPFRTHGPVPRRLPIPSGLKLPIGLVLLNELLEPLSLSHEDEEVRVDDLPRRPSCGETPFSGREGASNRRPLEGSGSRSDCENVFVDEVVNMPFEAELDVLLLLPPSAPDSFEFPELCELKSAGDGVRL